MKKIEALSTQRTDESFTDGIGSRGFKWGAQLLNHAASGYFSKPFTILLDIVPNEIPRPSRPRRCLSQLLRHPGIGRVTGDSGMKNATHLVGNNDEDVEGTE